MQTQKLFFCLFLSLFFSVMSFAQQQAAFHSLIYPRSVSSGGLGEQGVASGNALDAMQYNPANLAYSDKFSFSFFNNPWNMIGFHIPLTASNTALKLENGATVGVDYTNWDFGEVTYVTISDNPEGYMDEGRIHMYERSVAAGYAMPVGESYAVGIQARYAWRPYTRENYIQHLLFSAGVSATPEIFSERVTFGFSLMNFSTAIDGNGTEMEHANSPPSQINLGIESSVVTNEFSELSLALGIMKPIVKQNGPPDYKGQSSFSAFFTDWSDFPNDATAQAGLGFLWQPIDLGAGISFFQKMYLGYFTVGPAEYLDSFMTHGVSVGVQVHGITATAGYAGRWHNFRSDSYLRWDFPWETVQFGLHVNTDIFEEGSLRQTYAHSPLNILLSGGYAYGESVGKMKKSEFSGVAVSLSVKNLWSVESDFYISDNSALHTAVRYSKAMQSYDVDPAALTFPLMFIIPPRMEIDIETISFESGFRYHPVDEFHPLFVQGSFGIIRMNPVIGTSPRYYYQAFDELAVGCVLPILNTGLAVMPKVGLKTIFMKEYSNAERLGGYNQFTFGVNMGYEL